MSGRQTFHSEEGQWSNRCVAALPRHQAAPAKVEISVAGRLRLIVACTVEAGEAETGGCAGSDGKSSLPE